MELLDYLEFHFPCSLEILKYMAINAKRNILK